MSRAKSALSQYTAIPTWLFLLMVMSLGTLIRLFGLVRSSIWHDEGFTMMLIRFNPIEIWSRTARDVHPPFYYELLHFWTNLFGYSELGARSLSVAAGVGSIALAYLIARRLFDEGSARVAALFVAMAPYLVRYSQEARMYALLAFLLLLATWLLLRALDSNRWRDWLGYGVVLGLAMLTHYFAILIVPVHIGYTMARQRSVLTPLKNLKWWCAYLLGGGLFLLWFPSFLAQFTRGQGVGWISRPDANTLPNTVMQILTYSNLPGAPLWVKLLICAAIFVPLAIALVKRKRQRLNLLFITAYATFAPLLIWLVSFKKPLYVDRYFVFSMAAFYIMLAVLIAGGKLRRHPRALVATIIGVLLIFTAGLGSVYIQQNHRMKQLAAVVNAGYLPGDAVISGELYTYFDFSYYNQTGEPARIYQPHPPNGYGESGLFYERIDEVTFPDLHQLHPASGRVWMIGKTGKHDYFDKVPANWVQIGPAKSFNDNEVRLYQVDAAPLARVQ